MWLERSIMFHTLHSTIKDILDSTPTVKFQFILEPLTFPQLAICHKIHGPRFIEQLSYLTRTFAFYMHKEYQKILKLLKDSPLHPSTPMFDNTNPISVSAVAEAQPALLHTSHGHTVACQTTAQTCPGGVLVLPSPVQCAQTSRPSDLPSCQTTDCGARHTGPSDRHRALPGTRSEPNAAGHSSDPHGGDQVAVSVSGGGEGQVQGEVGRSYDAANHHN